MAPSPSWTIRSPPTCSPGCATSGPDRPSSGPSPAGLGALLVVEATRDLAVVARRGRDAARAVHRVAHSRVDLVAIPVLRAGLGLARTPSPTCTPTPMVGYLGMERDEETHEPRDYYAKLPPMAGGTRWCSIRCSPRVAPARAAARYVKAAQPPTASVRLRGGGARGPRAHGGRPPRRADRRRRARPPAQRERVHPAGPRRLRGPALRHGVRSSRQSQLEPPSRPRTPCPPRPAV